MEMESSSVQRRLFGTAGLLVVGSRAGGRGAGDPVNERPARRRPRDRGGAPHHISLMNSDTLRASTRPGGPAARLAEIQGLFYLVSGAWPLLSMRTFEAVTGPKTDKWLVRTVGLLLAVDGGALVMAARRGRIPPEVAVVGGGSAAALAATDLVYALRGRISRVYLLDAALQLALTAGWAMVGRSRSPRDA